MTMNLWDVKHPGDPAEGNYTLVPNANLHREYDSFRQFRGDWKLGHLLYRWDWIKGDKDYFTHGERKGKDRLMLFHVNQNHAYCMSVAVAVTDADQPAVREYLEGKAQQTRTLWEPLIDLTVDEALDQLI